MTIPGSANPLLLKSAAAAGPVQIERSLRFNSSDSASLSRTPASAGNRRTWTWAGWVKRSRFGTTQSLFSSNGSNDNTLFQFEFSSGDALRLAGSTTEWAITNSIYRDPSAWYHIVLATDTTQATASNRFKIWVNTVLVSQYSATNYPTQNQDLGVNDVRAHYIGAYFNTTPDLNGYLADIHFIDGQALTPSSFTEVSATTGQLIPKAYTGSFGTNGFWLKFSDNSNNTATTLGKDYSGNSNNWTPNNLSVTAGAGNDSLVDTPTSYGTDTGAGGEVRGNYATWNPLISSTNLTNGNLSVVQPSTTSASRYSTLGMSTGKWYWEISVVKYSNTVFGIRTPGGGTLETPYDSSGYGMGWRTAGGFFIGGSNTGTGSMSLAAGDVLGLAFDADAGTLKFYKNGTLNNTLTASSTYIGQTWFAGSQDSVGGNSDHDVNFGQRSWAYAPPSGHKALCDTNLPAPVVAKPSEVMDVKLYTGNGGTQTISGLGFSPDLVWIKARNQARWHMLFDTIRGPLLRLSSNDPYQEDSHPNSLTAFNSDGFSLGSDPNSNVNVLNTTHVAWCFDAGANTVSNTAGSITSSVRVNATSGCAVVTYSGSSSNSTIGHGLGVPVDFAIFKNRTNGGVNWKVYHKSLGNTKALTLNTTAAEETYNYWQNTTPTSTLFYLFGGVSNTCSSGDNFVAYMFSSVVGYSSFGSYTGNGSADGPFVYTGMRPRWLLIKRYDGAGNWVLIDTARNAYNTTTQQLFPNSSDAEYSNSAEALDILSNGFKPRSATSGHHNFSGYQYLYIALAESPFQYARAR